MYPVFWLSYGLIPPPSRIFWLLLLLFSWFIPLTYFVTDKFLCTHWKHAMSFNIEKILCANFHQNSYGAWWFSMNSPCYYCLKLISDTKKWALCVHLSVRDFRYYTAGPMIGSWSQLCTIINESAVRTQRHTLIDMQWLSFSCPQLIWDNNSEKHSILRGNAQLIEKRSKTCQIFRPGLYFTHIFLDYLMKQWTTFFSLSITMHMLIENQF